LEAVSQEVKKRKNREYSNYRNDEVENTILERIQQKQLQWYGHLKIMENDRFPKTVME
jgi:hypothetical protein